MQTGFNNTIDPYVDISLVKQCWILTECVVYMILLRISYQETRIIKATEVNICQIHDTSFHAAFIKLLLSYTKL
jgi:hypothetical protein